MIKPFIPKRMRQVKIPLRHQLLERKKQVTPWRAWRLFCSLNNKVQLPIAARRVLEYKHPSKELPFDNLENAQQAIYEITKLLELMSGDVDGFKWLLDAPDNVLYRLIENTSERDSDLCEMYGRVAEIAEGNKPWCYWSARIGEMEE
jgi:hypothetical protein